MRYIPPSRLQNNDGAFIIIIIIIRMSPRDFGVDFRDKLLPDVQTLRSNSNVSDYVTRAICANRLLRLRRKRIYRTYWKLKGVWTFDTNVSPNTMFIDDCFSYDYCFVKVILWILSKKKKNHFVVNGRASEKIQA